MTPSRNVRRLPLVLAAALAAALSSALLVAPPAQAAWQGVAGLHGARVQVCAVPAGSALRVRVRVDNRRSAHAHVGALQAPDGRSRLVRAAAGRLSGVESLVVGRRARVTVGIGERDGSGTVADDRRASRISRC